MPPLSGLRVLDLSRLLPGPYCTLLLADLGADVVRVEEPGGDRLRHVPPHLPDGRGAYYEALHRGKRSVALDLRSEDGRAALLALARTADVLVESWRPGVLAAMGLSWPVLQAANPRLVLASITGFGQTGPDRGRAGHDLGYMARAGALGIAGEAHGPTEAWPGVQVADLAGGSLTAAVLILAALRERDRTGAGSHLDVSITDGAAALLVLHHAALGSPGMPAGRGVGPLAGGFPCYGLYRTADGKQMALGALEPRFWSAFCAAAGRPDLEDRGFDRSARPEVEALFAGRDRDAWAELARGVDACLEPVWEGAELLGDPQLAARGMFLDVEGTPALRTGAPSPAALRAAPATGAHTRQLLEEAGVDPAVVDRIAPR
jgi:alpha-methylacyl-CoA racemase